MQSISLLEKEIRELLEESKVESVEKIPESIEEWEVIEKQMVQDQMQEPITMADRHKSMLHKGMKRTDSMETRDLIEKIDQMKESVHEQEAIRILERENSLELLDYGGTQGHVEQEAAVLLERVDQGFTQIIRDQSESNLITSLSKELTPDRQDTTLEEHESERMHQRELIEQIQEMQETTLLQEQIKQDEVIASLDKEHRQEKQKQMLLQDRTESMLSIEAMRESVLKRQGEIEKQMEQIQNTEYLKQELFTGEITGGIQSDQAAEGDWVEEHHRAMEHQSQMMEQISIMQEESRLLELELEDIAKRESNLLLQTQTTHGTVHQVGWEERGKKTSDEDLQLGASASTHFVAGPSRKPIDVLLQQPVVHRRKRGVDKEMQTSSFSKEMQQIELTQQITQAELELEMQTLDLDQQLRRLSVEYQKLMWETEKKGSVDSLQAVPGSLTQEVVEEEPRPSDDILLNLLPKGGRIDAEMAFEPIEAMKKTLLATREDMKKEALKDDAQNQQSLKQLNFLCSCVDAVEAQLMQMKTERKFLSELTKQKNTCVECKQPLEEE